MWLSGTAPCRLRIWPSVDGTGFERVQEPTPSELEELRGKVRRSRAESVAVCLLHSWADRQALEDGGLKTLAGPA